MVFSRIEPYLANSILHEKIEKYDLIKDGKYFILISNPTNKSKVQSKPVPLMLRTSLFP